MARHPRLIVPGVAVHVRQRGVNRGACFREDVDRLVYLSALRDAANHLDCAIHAYCLMTNHVHLLLTPEAGGACGVLMREIGRRYVPYFNKRYGRTGTLWEGRYGSCPVDSREYVLACYRYIERNPVRAGMVSVPSDYPWSSFLANTGRTADESVTAHEEYDALACDETARREAYRRFCETAEEEAFVSSVREATNKGLPLVGDALKSKLALEGSRVEAAKPGPRPEVEPVSGLKQGRLDL